MPHIHTEPGHHDHTISMYIFRTDFEEPKVMLHFHHKMKMYAQFGGHIELHEHPWQTVAHELAEETGYQLDQLHILQPPHPPLKTKGAVVHPYPVAHNTMSYPGEMHHHHTDIVYAFVTSQEPKGKPDDGESTDIQLFSRQEVQAIDKIDTITSDIALHIFDEILRSWQPTSPHQFKL